MFNLYPLSASSQKRLIFVAFFLTCLAFAPPLAQAQAGKSNGPCTCTNCPQFMPDGFTGNFYIQIQNAANPTLGQNGQGVCGVRLFFDHEYLGDLQITLTSPAGQSVTLVGPIGFFGPTDFTTWDVTFLPCGDAVNPDPGFANQWNNNQPWGLFGSYNGSYYPAGGCLENFNSGPVDGQWTLTVVDGQAIDVGNFYDYEIIFCDPAGINCFSCAANAGNLPQPDVNLCEGDPNLNLDLPPTYTPPVTPPPTPEYSYTYVVGGAGGVIQAYEPGPDLSAYPPGNYTVCGMSYLTAQEGDIPPPNGSLTINQLSTQLNSTTPPFCGKITANCVNVTIKDIPDDTEEFQEICAPQCYVFHGQNYCQTGTYVRNLVQNGCPYTATLHLTVLQPSFANISETICPGGCSQTPGFETACAPGVYSETFINAAGCDSLVNLTINVMSIVANIQQPVPQITCNQPVATLQGTGSTTGGGTTYLWTASNGGNIVGPATNINVNVNAPGNYQLRVCRTIGNVTCCDSTSVVVTFNPTPPAAPVPLNGPTQLCVGQTATFSITPVPGATYNWTVPPGVVINSNPNAPSIDVTWNSNNGGNVCVNFTNNCGTSPSTCLAVQVNTPPTQQPAIAGDTLLCEGANGTYSIDSISGATIYTWAVPINSSIVSGQNTTSITVNFSGTPGGNVCVVASNGCGAGPQNCLPVVVNEMPLANAGADDAECGTTASLQAITSVLNGTGSWVLVSGPGTVSFSNANAYATTVTASQTGAYIFQWTEINGNCSDADSVTITFNQPPVAGQITADCDNTNQNYTVSFPIVGGTAPFTVAGGTVTNGVFTSNPIPSGTSYAFLIIDANNCISPNITGTINCNCTTNAGQMNLLPLSACESDTIFAEHLGGETLDANDVTSFTLHNNSSPSLGMIIQQNTTGAFAFQNGMAYGTTYYVSFVVGNNLNGFPDPTDPCLSVAQGQPVTFFQNPVSNAGLDADTCGLTLQLLAGAGNGTGEWSVVSAPVGGNLIFSNQQDSASVVTASLSGTYVLAWTVDEDGCTGSDEVQIQFNESPILDSLTRNCDAANQNFTITLSFSGGTAPYSVNGSLAAGNTFTSVPFVNGQSYSFTVTDANGCSMPPVTGAYSCNCTTDAGAMQADTLEACEGTTVTVSANSVAPSLDANDVTGYVLHSGAGPALGQIFEQNATGIFNFQNGMNFGQTYYISLVAGNDLNGLPDPADPCFSVAAGQPVVFLQNPKPDAGLSLTTCGQTIDLQAVDGNFPGAWSQIAGPGTAVFSDPADPNSAANAPVFGTYFFQWTEANGACTGADSVSAVFNESPFVTALTEICNPANTQFAVTFTASGGAPSYTVSGLSGSFVGNNFTSTPLANNAAYSFTVIDANGCASPSVSGTQDCFCVTDAGSLQTLPAAFCAGDAATAIWNNNATLDSNDVVQFILHDQAGASVGNIFGTNNQPTFAFAANLQTGVTYYISAVAGNNVNGSVDLNDPCLSVAPGAPVLWKPLPTATLAGDAAICEGGSAILTFTGNGIFPLQITYSEAGGSQNSLTINNQQPVTLSVFPTTTTTFSLISVTDGTAPTCSSSLGDSVVVTVNQPLNAGQAHAPTELCAGTTLTLQLVNFLDDADFGGQWSETSAAPSLPGGFNAATGTFETMNQPTGTYTFRYLLSPPPPCPADEETVTVKLLAPPDADAGEDQAINCDQTAVLLGGENTSVGAGISHIWLLNGDTVGGTEQIFVSGNGDYTLIVNSSAGCSASDAVTVVLDNLAPQAEVISVKDLQCFGDKNGVITIDSVTAAHPPTLFSLNGGVFSPNPIFAGLAPGNYVVALLDANGCESSTPTITVGEPPELKIDLGADIEAALGDSVYLKALISVPATALDSILWKPLLDSTAAGKDFQRFLPLQSWRVKVTATDTSGCVAEDEILVRVDRRRHVYIPNIFNPGSAQQSVLQVYGGQDVAEVEVFRIYDRWGELVFESLNFQPNDPTHGWVGRHGGEDVSAGVFVYYAVVRFIDGEKEIFTGDVTVFR